MDGLSRIGKNLREADEKRRSLGIERVPTGVPRLDFLLKGGFFRGGLYVIQGQPGMGKTILGNQCCYHHASIGKTAVYVTLLAESTGRMVSYLQPMKFVKPELVRERLHYVSGYNTLKKEGLAGLQALLRKVVTDHQAAFLVLDGVDTIAGLYPNESEYREFIHALQAFLSMASCTALFLTASASESGKRPVEHAVADGVIELSEWRVGPRAVREIQILKFRGSDFLKGGHEIEITDEGVAIHPRTEVQFSRPSEGSWDEQRVRMTFGISKFDEMLHGGVLSGSMTTLFGAPGTGKTCLGLSFLAQGVKQGECGIYFGFYETPPRLLEKARSLGLDLESAEKKGLVEFQWQPPVENITDALAERLLERIREKKEKRIRVFIDGMSGFRRATPYPERFGSFLASFTHELRNAGATTLFSEESDIFGSEPELPNRELGSVVDNVFFLRYVELRSQLYRLISIMKVRESAYESAIREFNISGEGITVSNSFESAEAILTGHGRVVSQQQNPNQIAPHKRSRAKKRGEKR